MQDELPLPCICFGANNRRTNAMCIVGPSCVRSKYRKLGLPAPLLFTVLQHTTDGSVQWQVKTTHIGDVDVVLSETCLCEVDEVSLLFWCSIPAVQAVHNDAFGSSILRGGTIAAIAGSLLQDELPLARRRVNSDDSCARPIAIVGTTIVWTRADKVWLPTPTLLQVDQHTACGISKGALQTSHASAGIHRVPAETVWCISQQHLLLRTVSPPLLQHAGTDVSLATEEFIPAQHWVNDQWQDALHSEVRACRDWLVATSGKRTSKAENAGTSKPAVCLAVSWMGEDQSLRTFAIKQLEVLPKLASSHYHAIVSTVPPLMCLVNNQRFLLAPLRDLPSKKWVWVNTYRYIFSGMNIHLPAILMFTRYQGFDPSPNIIHKNIQKWRIGMGHIRGTSAWTNLWPSPGFSLRMWSSEPCRSPKRCTMDNSTSTAMTSIASTVPPYLRAQRTLKAGRIQMWLLWKWRIKP